jgi:DNA-directed RNA polymerase subunit RPC12/RpoP
MPVIRCERCGASQYVAAADAMLSECARCGHQMSLTRKSLLGPVLAIQSRTPVSRRAHRRVA